MDFGDLDQIDPSVFGLGMEDMPVFDYDPIDFSVFEDVFIEPLDISDHIKPPEFGDLRYLNYVKPRPGAGGDTAGTNAAAEETHLSESLLPPDVSQKLDDALEAIVTVVGASENKSEVKAEPDGASESSSKISIPNSQLSTVLREVSCGLHQDLNEDTFGDFFENSTAENDINDVDGEVASERDSNKSFTPKPKFEKREDVVLHTPAASEVFSQEEEPVEPVEATTGKKCDEESLLEKEPTVNDTQDANNNSGEVAENDNEIHDSNGIESEANEPLEKLKPDKTTKAKDNTPPEKVLQERRVTRQQVPQEIKKQGNSGDRPAKMIPIIKKATKRTRPKTIEPDVSQVINDLAFLKIFLFSLNLRRVCGSSAARKSAPSGGSSITSTTPPSCPRSGCARTTPTPTTTRAASRKIPGPMLIIMFPAISSSVQLSGQRCRAIHLGLQS